MERARLRLVLRKVTDCNTNHLVTRTLLLPAHHQLWIFAVILRINITGEVPITNLYNNIKMIKGHSHHIHVYKESETNALHTLNFSTKCMTDMCPIHRNEC